MTHEYKPKLPEVEHKQYRRSFVAPFGTWCVVRPKAQDEQRLDSGIIVPSTARSMDGTPDAGVIARVGDKVTKVRVGDEVCWPFGTGRRFSQTELLIQEDDFYGKVEYEEVSHE